MIRNILLVTLLLSALATGIIIGGIIIIRQEKQKEEARFEWVMYRGWYKSQVEMAKMECSCYWCQLITHRKIFDETFNPPEEVCLYHNFLNEDANEKWDKFRIDLEKIKC